MNGFPIHPIAPFKEPPKPAQTLAELRAENETAWRVMQWRINNWIAQILPEPIPGDFGSRPVPDLLDPLDGDIAGEAKLEAIGKLLDKGYLRVKIGPRNRRGTFPYHMEVWNGQRYRMVGRGRVR